MTGRGLGWSTAGGRVALGLVAAWAALGIAQAKAAEPPRDLQHVVVYREPGRFAGWPANNGMWIWGDEILVGFSRGSYKDLGQLHNIDREKPEEFLLARSLDAGLTWKVEEPRPPGALMGTRGVRHGTMPPGATEERLTELETPMDFTAPGFALTLRMENKDAGVARFYYSTDRGRAWRGPYRFPMLGQKGVMARTDYLVSGPRDCLVFLTASKPDGKEGRPFCARTTDGGRSWSFLSYIGPEPGGYSIMPSTVRSSPTDLLSTIRVLDPPRSAIDAYASTDDGRSWAWVSTPEPDAGEGNPPSLVKLHDGRLCLTYGERKAPFSIRARLSSDRGRTWTEPITLRDDAGGRDIGYARSVVRPDGKVVAVYYFHDRTDPTRYLAGTIWTPDKP